MQQDAQHEAHAVLVSDLNRPAGNIVWHPKYTSRVLTVQCKKAKQNKLKV